MNMHMNPYRELQAQPTKSTLKVGSGVLVRRPTSKQKHVCETPNWFRRIWNSIRFDDLWVCSTCGSVWELRPSIYDGYPWWFIISVDEPYEE